MQPNLVPLNPHFLFGNLGRVLKRDAIWGVPGWAGHVGSHLGDVMSGPRVSIHVWSRGVGNNGASWGDSLLRHVGKNPRTCCHPPRNARLVSLQSDRLATAAFSIQIFVTCTRSTTTDHDSVRIIIVHEYERD